MLVAVAGGKPNAQRPSITTIRLCETNCPRKLPCALNTLIFPSPRFPISTTGPSGRIAALSDDPIPPSLLPLLSPFPLLFPSPPLLLLPSPPLFPPLLPFPPSWPPRPL